MKKATKKLPDLPRYEEPPSPRKWVRLPSGTWRRGTALTAAEAVPVDGGWEMRLLVPGHGDRAIDLAAHFCGEPGCRCKEDSDYMHSPVYFNADAAKRASMELAQRLREHLVLLAED